jgi:hypothetical protein
VNEELEQSSFVRITEHELRELFNFRNVHHLFRSEVGKETHESIASYCTATKTVGQKSTLKSDIEAASSRVPS